jgi:hypothetical protein
MQFKKIAAVAGTAIMAGMTLAGPALASKITGVGNVADMVSVTGSVPSFPLFVIGQNAATADVAGAVDMAVNLAANAKVTTSVTSTIPGESVMGGVKLATSGVPLSPYTNPQSVKGIVTASDIPSLLNGGTYSTASGGAYNYKQYIYILGDAANTNPAQVVYARPTTENSPRLALKTPGSSKLYTYKLTFSTPVSLSGVTSTTLLQGVIQGTTINFLGKDFVISDCTWDTTNTRIQDITMLGGKNIVTAETGTPQTVSVDSKDYTVALTGVAAQSVGGNTYYSAIGDVNGESFTLKAGETKTLSDGTLIASIKVFQGKTGAPDYATIAIGADKVQLTQAGTVSKGTTVVSELSSSITSSSAAGWSVLKIEYTPSQDAWLAAGSSIADPFSSTFNIKFNSVVPDLSDTVNRQSISFSPSGYNMLMTYKNAADAEKQMYSLYYDSGTWRWMSASTGTITNGDNTYRDVVFDEGQNISAIDQDYFVLEKGGFSHTLQFSTYTNSTKQYTFTDESGNSITATGSTGVAGDIAELIVDGNTFKVLLVDDTKRIVNIDLNANGKIAGVVSPFTSLLSTPGTYTGKEYSNLVPKLITTGQGGLYLYNGNKTTAALTSGNHTVGAGAIPLIVGNASNVFTLYNGDNSIGTLTMNATNNIADTASYLDTVAICGQTTCSIGLGTAATGMLTDPGFVLVEEARAGGATHNWIYVPVKYDSTNSRTYVGTTLYSDDTNYADLSVLGTSTQYKGMTTYGTLADHLSSTLGGSGTLSYPDVFTYANVYVLSPTGTVSSSGVSGSVTSDKILPITADVVKLDSEVTESDKQNNDLIVVGGPCINTVAAAVLDVTYPACGAASGIPTNAALIKVVADKFATGKSVLLVAGWEAADSDLAARIVQTGFIGATSAQKAASELTVTGTVASPSYS